MAEKHMSKAEKEARAMLADMKERKANTRAYDAADSTPPAPMPAPVVPPRPMPTPPPAPTAPMPPQGAMPPRPIRPRPQAMGAPDEDMAVMKKGGSVSSASKRADGIATKGKTRGKMC